MLFSRRGTRRRLLALAVVCLAALIPATSGGDAGCLDCPDVLLFFNGEGCGTPVCDAPEAGYTLDPTREFSAGDVTIDFVSAARVDQPAALYGDRGLFAGATFDQAIFGVTDGDILDPTAGSLCLIARQAGVAAETKYRLFTAKTAATSSLMILEFFGTDDFRLIYRDAAGVATSPRTDGWDGAATTDAMLIQVSYDSLAPSDALRLIVDGVERGRAAGSVESLGPINELKIGNSSSSNGAFHIDPFVVSSRADLDCWDMLAGTCGSASETRCIDDADCPAGESCLGVVEDYPQLIDACPDDPNKFEPGACGCGVADVDLDLDEIADCIDGCFDLDGDGYGVAGELANDCLGLDCDDGDATIHAGASEVTCDGVDNDCNAATPDLVDADADGFDCGVDCDESDPSIHPGADELACDGLDNDCDEATTDVRDVDGDAFACDVDCDESDPSIHPGAAEVRCDGLDNDCDPATPDLLDGDGNAFTSLKLGLGMLEWSFVPGAIGYDVLRGDLASLRDTGGGFAMASDECLADNYTLNSFFYAVNPAPGAGDWFLVRPVGVEGLGGYDTCDVVDGRDAEIAESGVDCP